MKYTLSFTALFFCFAASTVIAQPDIEQRSERIRAFRAAIFTEELQLTAKEAEGFWPLYYEFLAQKEKLNEQYTAPKSLESMTNAEAENLIRNHFERQHRELDLEKELYNKLRNVLPARKIARLPRAERLFRESLIQKLKEIRARRNRNEGHRHGSGEHLRQ